MPNFQEKVSFIWDIADLLRGPYKRSEYQDVILSDSDLLIATPEKIDLLLRLNPEFFENVSFVVVDEGHIIGDISTRATLLEFLIIRLRIKIPALKTLFISAVMPPENANAESRKTAKKAVVNLFISIGYW